MDFISSQNLKLGYFVQFTLIFKDMYLNAIKRYSYTMNLLYISYDYFLNLMLIMANSFC